MTCGVYKITCRVNGRIYIGSSVNIKIRWRNHRYELGCGKHFNRHLQRAWSKYGSDSFEFSILEVTSHDCRVTRELHWCKELRPAFNVNVPDEAAQHWHYPEEARAKISRASSSRKHRPESIELMRKIHKRQANTPEGMAQLAEMRARNPKVQSAETIAKRAQKLKGHPVTVETRAKISAANKKAHADPDTRAKMSAINKGRVISAQGRANMSAAHKGNSIPPEQREKLSLAMKRYWANRKEQMASGSGDHD
jgi:group I intron endonuclease